MDRSRTDVDPRNTPLPRLTTAQAAARLGVKPATLYAYVARGLLVSTRAERGGSTFDPLEVEAFAAARRRPAALAADEGRPLMVLDSPITDVGDGRLRYRGQDAVELSRRASFEQAVAVLWAGPAPSPDAFRGGPEVVGAVRTAAQAVGASGLDLLRLAVLSAGAADPLRHDLAPEAVRGGGARMVGTMVDALGGTGSGVAERLWSGLAGRVPDAAEVGALDAALVLSSDHDLAVSTLAARVAASARADPYACVQAALGAFGGSLHGRASSAAADLLTDAVRSQDPERALSRAVARTGGVPGFGNVVHRRHDPRAVELLARLRPIPRFAESVRVADRLAAVVGDRLDRPANLDLALAALAVGGGLAADAGTTVFAIARTAGWIAHVADEYTAEPLRLRPRSRYSGPA